MKDKLCSHCWRIYRVKEHIGTNKLDFYCQLCLEFKTIERIKHD